MLIGDLLLFNRLGFGEDNVWVDCYFGVSWEEIVVLFVEGVFFVVVFGIFY